LIGDANHFVEKNENNSTKRLPEYLVNENKKFFENNNLENNLYELDTIFFDGNQNENEEIQSNIV
jgi:hypothetical protein